MAVLGGDEKAIAEILREREEDPAVWLCMVFIEFPSRWLGALVLFAHGPMDALAVSKMLGANPGGQATWLEVASDKVPTREYRNRLLDMAEAAAAFPDGVSALCRTSEPNTAAIADVSKE